jgi:tetratricopeptide (TPR) repeat protein
MSPVKMMMRIAAAVVLLLASVTAVQYFTSTGSSFYNNLNENYVVNNTREPKQASTIVEAYQAGNYKRTIELFEQINNPGNRELFITANSWMQLNNTARSIELYQQILNNNKTTAQKFYQDEAEYYLAMAYLKNNETDKALPILTQIADDKNHTYHDKIDKWTLFKMKWFGH